MAGRCRGQIVGWRFCGSPPGSHASAPVPIISLPPLNDAMSVLALKAEEKAQPEHILIGNALRDDVNERRRRLREAPRAASAPAHFQSAGGKVASAGPGHLFLASELLYFA
jgi:hypothetical protein